jgi:hypothetical protein
MNILRVRVCLKLLRSIRIERKDLLQSKFRNNVGHTKDSDPDCPQKWTLFQKYKGNDTTLRTLAFTHPILICLAPVGVLVGSACSYFRS